MTRPLLRIQLAAVSLAIGGGCALFSAPVGAAQFVVVDVEYTHGPETTTDSHYAVDSPPTTPQNWTKFQICFLSKPDYSCTDQSPTYTAPGTITWATPFENFYIGNGGNVDWSQGTDRLTLILKDTKNVKPAPENVGAETAARYMPTDLHVIVTLVPQGEVYVPPVTEPVGGGGAGGGAGGAQLGGAGGGGTGGAGATGTGGSVSGGNGGAPAVGVMPAPSGGVPAGAGGPSAAPTSFAGTDAGCGFVRGQVPLGAASAGALLALACLTARRRRPRGSKAHDPA